MEEALIEMYLSGVSVRRVEDITEALWGTKVSPGTISNLNKKAYVSTLQEELVRADVLPPDYDFEGHRELVGMQPGDVPVTYADSKALEVDYGFRPSINIREGLRKFAVWYKEY